MALLYSIKCYAPLSIFSLTYHVAHINSYLLFTIIATSQSDVMKSILYVAIFVACMFLITGVLKSKSANNKLKDAFEEFISFLKTNNLDALTNKYPVFIDFRNHGNAIPEGQVQDIRQQQQVALDIASARYHFTAIADIKIDKINRRAFQYESATDATITGQLIYNDASYKDFIAVLQHDKVYSLSINGECVLNNKCVPK